MHANNETGNLLDIQKVSEICTRHNAILHSDTVQTLGHYLIDFSKLNIHFITGAAHKFHGPKGTGLLYINEKIKIKPNIHGGAQERNMRAGTENVYGIVGFSKAFELASQRMEEDRKQIDGLRVYMADELKKAIPELSFNGDPFGKSLYTILSVSFPKSEETEMLLFNLDINHICASGGSACTSGVEQGSHVIRAINNNPNQVTVRFSFSKHNKREEIEQVVAKLKDLI